MQQKTILSLAALLTLSQGVGIIHRGPMKDRADGATPGIAHHHQTETYIIVSGSGPWSPVAPCWMRKRFPRRVRRIRF